MKTLRTPDERFANLADFPYQPHYVEVPGPLRMHYVDEGQGDVILCIHGEPSWSYLYRKMIPTLSKHGRVIAVDLVGFGRSDKPVGKDAYTYALHHDALSAFVEKLDLKRVTLVCQDWGGLLGLPIATEMPDRFARLVIMNTGLPVSGKPLTPGFMAWRTFSERAQDMDIGRVLEGATVSKLTPEVLAAYNAPFPDLSYKGGALQFPLLGADFRRRRGAARHAAHGRSAQAMDQAGADHVFRQGSRDHRRRQVLSRADPLGQERAGNHDSRRRPFSARGQGGRDRRPHCRVHRAAANPVRPLHHQKPCPPPFTR